MSAQNIKSMELRNLLSKWKLDCIFSHLLAEKIDIDVLKMMKPSHIRLLLYNFPLGIQIRFEYNLELWRQEMGKPFHTLHTVEDSYQCLSKANVYRTETTPTVPFKDTITTSQQKTRSSLSSVESQHYKPPLPSEQLSTNLKSGNLKTTRSTPQIDLHKILSNSAYGMDLIKNYRLRKSFSNLERKLLITTIVNYYLQNNKEFNVQISYALERAILKMFPSEKLNYYRITKRGRIYMRYIAAKTAMKQGNGNFNENSNSLDCAVTANENNDHEMDEFSNDIDLMNQVHNTAESVASGMTNFDEDDNGTAMLDNSDSTVGYITADYIENAENSTEIKIEPESLDETPSTMDLPEMICPINSGRQQRIEETARLFKDFTIPWHKVPIDIITLLENQEELGKRLNTFANLIVDELRSISKNIPMRVLRAVTQEAVIKYPYSLLEKDADGKLITSSTMIPLLSRMRNRNTFLNR